MSVFYPYEIVYEIGETLLTEDLVEKKEKYFLDNYKAEVHPNEGNIPHIHFRKRGKPDTCICIYTNEIFVHGKHIGTFDNSECRELDKWLRKKNSRYYREIGELRTNWEVAATL